jgi:N6-adenosine-specific RNA methylase IME4
MKHHPAADVFPMMTPDVFEEHKADIKANGQMQPITICEGMILDGRNRYKACMELEIAPMTVTYIGNPWTYAWSANGSRRDLQEVQRAMIHLLCNQGSEKWEKKNKNIADEANAKRSAAAKGQHAVSAPRRGETLVVVQSEQQPKADRAKGRASRAAEANVTSSTQAKAEQIFNSRPDLAKNVAAGTLKPAEALRVMKRDKIAKEVPVPSGKYRVIYADPPWSYGNTQPDYQTEQRDHYPVMKLSDICALPVKDWAEDDAVLFLWVTSPILEDSFKVINAWGFKYKASFVWDKVKHNMGHYNSVRHEFLLVCTRGACQPDERKLFDSVQTIERTKHSKKPVEFYDIIDTIYNVGTRLEMFARSERKGWAAYGHEVTE